MRILVLLLSLVCAGSAWALTPKDVYIQQNEKTVDILIAQYQSSIHTQASIKIQVNSIQGILNLSGVNWPGEPWNNPQYVNWSSIK